MRVSLRRITGRPEINGAQGQLVRAVPGGDRWLVSLLNGESLHVRSCDLLFPAMLGRLYVYGGCSVSETVSSTEVFNIRTGLFEEPADAMARPRCHMCTSAIGARLYAFGGFDGLHALRTTERLDPTQGTWERLPDMAEARVFACSAVLGGMVYVAGGRTVDSVCLASAERWSPARHEWQSLPGMRHARAFAAAAAMSRRNFLVCGGYNEAAVTSAECFTASDSSAGKWTDVGQMPFCGVYMAKAIDEFDNLYLCGGASSVLPDGTRAGVSLRTAQRFNLRDPRWELLPPMLMERVGASAGAIGQGRICVCGGLGLDGVDTRTVECYSPSADSWSFLAPMQEPRSSFMSRVVGGRLYVFGGRQGSNVLRSGERYYWQDDTWVPLPLMSVPRASLAVDLV